MDGFFACPECGSAVEVEGLAPGRQVRCDFCHRLLEVPYLPRVPSAGWKRRRFGQGKWVRWAWSGLAVVAVLAAIVSGVRFARRQYRSAQEDTITRLLATSRKNEAEGRLNQALVDQDAAIDLIQRSGVESQHDIEQERTRRDDLARRDAQAALDQLLQQRRRPYPVGDWLNLIARSRRDPALSAIGPRIEEEFRRNVRAQGTLELEAARRDFESDRVVASLAACNRIATLLPHVASQVRGELRKATEELVARLVETHGVSFETQRGTFVVGSYESYNAHLVPVLIKALEAKGYLPYQKSTPWKSAWQKALYQLRLEVSEHLEGNYLSTENRLTRIEARLTLTKRAEEVWTTRPNARTTVPVPGLPAYLSRNLALSPARSAELERLLYDNARGQIEAKFLQALGHLKPCCP